MLVVITAVCSFPIVANAGAWGEGSFDNDDALDWVATCVAARSVAPVKDALERALRNRYVELPEGSGAVVAAEVIAAAKGRPHPKLPAELATWTKRQPAGALAQLAPLAKRALARLRNPKVSELRGSWDEGNSAKWLKAVAELESRLR